MKISVLVALCFAASLAFAQQSGITPTFQAGTKLVEVDVVAKSKGVPAKGLTKEDFTLTDNGKRQNIALFSVRSAKTVHQATETPLPPGTYSNHPGHDSDSPGRTTVILLDQLNNPRELQVYAIARVRKYLQSDHGADRLAIYTLTGRGLLVIQDLTGDPVLLKRAAAILRARDPDPRSKDTTGMTEHEAQGYAAMQITGPVSAVRDSLTEIARHLAKVPGRKNLVWVTTAFRLYDIALGLDWRQEMEHAAHALNSASIALYAIDARGLMGVVSAGLVPIMSADSPTRLPSSPRAINATMHLSDEQNPLGFDTEQMLSSLTGGQMFFNKSNAIEESIATAVEDGDFTYTLGFYPDESTQDSQWHNIKVHVSRPGAQRIELRYRTSYFAGTEDKMAPMLEQILRDPLDSAQIELRAEVHPDPARPGIVTLKVNIDLHDVAFTHANFFQTGTIDLSFYEEGGHRVFTKPLKVEIPDSRFAAVLKTGLDAIAPIAINRGVEALRIVAQDKTTGAAGSVTVPLPAR